MNAKEIHHLKIYRQEIYAADLHRTSSGCELKLRQEFLNSSRFNELTYQIPKQEASFKHEGVNLPPFFAGLLPEGLRLKLLIKQLKTSEDDLFSLLASIGSQTVGDVYVKSERNASSLKEPPKIEEIDIYEYFLKSIEDDSSTQESLAGVQEKISASMISLPLRGSNRKKSYILKLNPKDKPNLVQNEYHCLELARKCGFTTNDAKLLYDKHRNPVLLVERFDRKNFQMIHQEDACQFMNKYPADKYRIPFSEIVEQVSTLSTAPKIDTLKLILHYAFSYLIGNGDLHAKNISLQTDPKTGRIQLTPAYDLICTYLYKDRYMALKLDGKDANIKRNDLLKLAVRFEINEKSISTALDKMLFAFNKHHALFLQADLTDKEKALFLKMAKERLRDLS